MTIENQKEPTYTPTNCPFCSQPLPESSYRELLAMGPTHSIPCPTVSCSAYVKLRPTRQGNVVHFSARV